MIILYVKGKKGGKGGKIGKSSRELRGGYVRNTLVFGFFTVGPFFDRFSRRHGRFWHHSDKPILPSQILKALCLDVVLPEVFRVPIKVIVIDGKLRNFIHDVWGGRSACAVHADRRVMDFRWRSGSDQPNAQMFEDGPDNRRIFDADDDPHGTLTFSLLTLWFMTLKKREYKI